MWSLLSFRSCGYSDYRDFDFDAQNWLGLLRLMLHLRFALRFTVRTIRTFLCMKYESKGGGTVNCTTVTGTKQTIWTNVLYVMTVIFVYIWRGVGISILSFAWLQVSTKRGIHLDFWGSVTWAINLTVVLEKMGTRGKKMGGSSYHPRTQNFECVFFCPKTLANLVRHNRGPRSSLHCMYSTPSPLFSSELLTSWWRCLSTVYVCI